MMTNPVRLELPGKFGVSTVPLQLRAPATKLPPEFVITQCPRAGEPLTATFGRVAEELAAQEADLLNMFIFGSIAAREEINHAMRTALGEPHWPITWVEGLSCDGSALAGVQVFATSSRVLTRVRLGGRVVGSVYEDGGARHCMLGGLGPTSLNLMRPAQVQQTLGNLEWALDMAGFTLADVLRTWFYNEDIVPWYGDFNRVRSAHYDSVAWRTGSSPASTGIGARNPSRAALVVGAWAVQPLDGAPVAREIGSPLQCPAPAYGSTFSRAVEIDSGGWRRLLVSGTASIHPDGRTAWIGNPMRQIDLTMEVIEALLQSRGMGFRDITRATAYFEHPLFQPYFVSWCKGRGLEGMPVVATNCDICRDDLLFELELDAVVRSKETGAIPNSAQDSTTTA
jgi:enamine deaminase RidA (YjgF/YER057c/UK114 family)